jgi:hypothetical protein
MLATRAPRTRSRRPLRAVVVAVVALGVLPAVADTASGGPGDPITPVITVTADPASPVLLEEFWVVFNVQAGGAPAPDGPIQVTLGGGAPVNRTLAGGEDRVSVLVGTPHLYTASITYPWTDTIAGAAAGSSFDFVSSRTSQTVTLSGLPTGATAGETLSFATTATSSLSVVTTTSGPCSVSGSSVVTTGAGTCAVTAAQSGSDTYAPAAATWSIAVTEDAAQTVSFDASVPLAMPFQTAPITLAATATSGLPVTFAWVSGPCSLAGDQLTMTSSGGCQVEAAQAGGPGWLPATTQRLILVTPVMPTVTITTNPNPVVPGEPFDITFAVNAGSAEVPDGGLITYMIGTNPLGQVALAGGVAHISTTLSAPWHGSILASYGGAPGLLGGAQTLQLDLLLSQSVGLAAALAGPIATGAEVGDGPFPLPATTSAGLPVAYLGVTGPCTVVDGKLRLTGLGKCHVEGSNPGTSDVEAVLEGIDITVRPTSQTITITGAPTTFAGPGKFTVNATSSAGGHVTIGASGACTASGEDAAAVTVVGVGECVITASSAGDALTAPGTATARVAVTAGPVSLDLTLDRKVGDPAAGASVNATGTGLQPGVLLSVTVYSDPILLGSTITGATGAGEVFGTLPALGAGTHRLLLAGTALDGSAVRAELAFGVGADGTITWIRQATPGGTAATGSEIGDLVTLAALTMLAGAALLVARRRLLMVPVPTR